MVRNEADIISVWLSHLLALFDDVFIADHMSDDGTYEFLRAVADANGRLRVMKYREPSYDQDVVFELLRQNAIESTEADILFILDADEFLPFADRDEFHRTISASWEHNLMRFRWRNCYPAQPGTIEPSFSGFGSTSLSEYGKVAMKRHLAMDPLYRIPKGAHWLTHSMLGVVPGAEVSELLHFPVRSMTQIWQKVLQGSESYLAIPDYNGLEGAHWLDMLNCLLSRTAGWELAPALVHQYGTPRTAELMASANSGFEPWNFKFAVDETIPSEARLIPATQRTSVYDDTARLKEVLARLSRIDLRDGRSVLHPESLSLFDGQIRHVYNLSGKHFDALPPSTEQDISLLDLAAALDAAFADIRFGERSRRGEHIPLLFALISLLRPRRYVELGVEDGVSFFAVCQAMRERAIAGESIAVDDWSFEGDQGSHRSAVFASFRNQLVSRHLGEAGYIRDSFPSALDQFEDGSVDLLHVDGARLVGDLRDQFGLWLGKLSDRGAVVFSSASYLKQDFSIWRFWRLLREQYPFLEFGHGDGAGVLLVGAHNPLRHGGPSIGALSSPEFSEPLQVLFGHLGRMSWTERLERQAALRLRDQELLELEQRYSKASARVEVREIAIPSREQQASVDTLQARINSLESRLARYDQSIYGRVRRTVSRFKRAVRNNYAK